MNFFEFEHLSFHYVKGIDGAFRILFVGNHVLAAPASNDISNAVEIELFPHSDRSLIDRLRSQPNHIAFLKDASKKNDCCTCEIFFLSNLVNVDDFNIESPSDTSEISDAVLFTDISGQDCMLLGVRENDLKQNLFAFALEDSKCILIEKKIEVDDEGKQGTYYSIGKDEKLRRIPKKWNSDDCMFILFFGSIYIGKEREYLPTIDLISLEESISRTSSYLSLWERYSDLEWEQGFHEAKEFGNIPYRGFQREGKNLRVYFYENDYEKVKGLSSGDYVLLGDGSLRALTGEGITRPTEYLNKERALSMGKSDEAPSIFGAIIKELSAKNDDCSILVRLGEEAAINSIPNRGFLALSLVGDMTVFKRREAAKKKIWSNKAGMPNLLSVFTDEPSPCPNVPQHSIDYSLLQGKNLTVNQKEAIRIILNTPDFAIIQGPPGTGKTTVISLALAQLNAIDETSKKGANNLLCAFRQETVEHLAGKVSIYGLPTPKLGRKNTEVDDDDALIEKNVKEYVDDLLEKLDEKYHDLRSSSALSDEFSRRVSNYGYFSHSIEETKSICEYALSIPEVYENEEWVAELNRFLAAVKSSAPELNYFNCLFLDLLYMVPVNQTQYDDDVDSLLLQLEEVGASGEADLKKDAADLISALKTVPTDFARVNTLRTDLILKYKPRKKIFIDGALKEEVYTFLQGVAQALSINAFRKKDGEQRALYQYVNSLEENPVLLRKTILDYAKAIGITNQQSYSRAITDSKIESREFFDNVFVDEAATSAPLDLFLPMSLAGKRIILVGDHRQLPNIVDEGIAKRIEEEGMQAAEDIDQILKRTLFEYLWKQCKILEQKDGIQRTITLNQQFRMHPAIGNLVSKHFYAEEGGILSPRPAEEFHHHFLGLMDVPLYWFHVPYSSQRSRQGREKKSRFNADEVDCIIQKIETAINAPDFDGESIGVITFFRPQSDRLIRAANETLNYKESGVAYTHDGREVKLEIGTVDAFQGKEFDIVFLSVVLSADINRHPSLSYSRLVNKNLLCVALSRAIKTLFVAGNIDLFDGARAQHYCPSLTEIAAICKKGGFVSYEK